MTMLRLYNTLTKRKERFAPLRKGQVGLYACGPSVYLAPHIGNFKTYVFEDVLRRWLEYRGYRVKHVMNITDVEDKGVRDADGSMKKLVEITEKHTHQFFKDAKTLGLLKPTHVPKATAHVRDMVGLIGKLMKRGYAYEWEDGNIYYDISKFKNYCRLSRTPRSKFAGIERRVSKDDYWQYEMGDFVLWKARRRADGDMWWRSPWGKGRPGWNIECSAMCMRYLGPTADIHAGGSDLVFSHHDNEIAQSEGATGRKFVRYWMHCRHLLINGQKMSKSLRNYYTVGQLMKRGYDGRAIRYMLLSGHYRKRFNFTFKRMREFARDLRKVDECYEILKNYKNGKRNQKIEGKLARYLREFGGAMGDDLNAPHALTIFIHMMGELHGLARRKGMSREEAGKALATVERMNEVLAVL